jgi:periplasmic protein TonB
VKITIDKDGVKDDVQVVKGLSPDADMEAMRVVNIMPDWVPAMKNGKTVKTKRILPIRFRKL